MKQTIGNSCGTIGLIHAVANNQDKLEFGMCEFLGWSISSGPLVNDNSLFQNAQGSIQQSHCLQNI